MRRTGLFLKQILTPKRTAIYFAFILGAAVSVPAQDALVNGGLHTGTVSIAGETDSWTFTAVAGSGVVVRMGATNFPPRLRVFDPSNALAGEINSLSVNTRDVVLTLVATNAGTYTVLANSATAAIGGYGVHLAVAPGEFIIPAGDEGGLLENGANNPGTISLGDLDLWRFNAAAGDSLLLRMGGAFTPWIRLYGPDGALVGNAVSGSVNTRDVFLSAVATNAGNYTVVASSTVTGTGGAYSIHLARAPSPVVVTAGDQGGELNNGARTTGEITVGDLDVWRFDANAGDAINLRMGGAFAPWIRLYGPNGAIVNDLLSLSVNTRDVALTTRATNSGTYLAVVSSTVSGSVGAYDLHLAKSPGEFVVTTGDDGGSLTNGVNNAGTITLGDLDLWRFEATAGDALMLRMGGAFTPLIRLYGPVGALVGEAISGSLNIRDVVMTATATNTGTYMAVVSSTVSGSSGAYNLHLAQSPEDFLVSTNDEGGELINGSLHEGTIALGDLDLWEFTAAAGDGVVVRMGAIFAPWLRILGPNGELVGNVVSGSVNTRDLFFTGVATNAGVYTVVASSTVSGSAGEYDLHFAMGRGELTITPGDEGGTLANGATNTAVLSLGDIDAWSFFGTVRDSNVFRVTATNFAPWIRLYGPTGQLVGESIPASVNTRSATLSYELTNNPGNYTIVIASGVSGQSGSYAFKQSRWAPDLNVPQNAAIDEGATLNVSITAQDPDEPGKPLQFELISAPPGVTFNVTGATNANIAWATSEADGPQTNEFVAVVTDVVNGRTFKRTNSFSVIVREINVAPQITVPNDMVINELTLLGASTSATDIDIPANPLTFALLAAPEGMTIDSATGAIAWTPTEAQGPSTNTVTVVVTDDSPRAANEKNLSATNSFVVIVREVNLAPTIVVPVGQTLDELTSLNVNATSADADLPTNGRTFTLVAPPGGMIIDPVSGAITWTPTEAQGGTTNTVTVVVTDSSPLAVNEPALGVTNAFTVIVREVNRAPVLPTQNDRTIDEGALLSLVNAATDEDLPTNIITHTLVAAPTNATISANGTISWTPSEEQGLSTNVFTTIAQDNGNPVLSVTNTFTVIVREVNRAPALPSQDDRTIDEGTPLSVANAATDDDLPANIITYTLVGAPTNATISANGIISWTPTEGQGPGTNVLTTIAQDNGSPALSTTNTVTVIVTEKNTAPVIAPLEGQVARFGVPFRLRIDANDADIPANTLSYAVEQGPTNLTVSASGDVSWTPLQSQVGNHSVMIRVMDNGSPSLGGTVAFPIQVTGDETRLGITRLTSGLMQITINGNSGVNYELERSSNLVTWEMEFEFRLTTSPFNYIDPNSQGPNRRFYRLKESP